MATLDEILSEGNYTLAVRALVMAPDLVTVLHEVPGALLDGSVSGDRKREVFRTASVSLANDDAGTYSPTSSSAWVWPHRLWRLERGAYVDGVAQYVSLITGLLDEPRQGEGDAEISFTLWSRLRLADQQFSVPVAFLAATRLRDVIRRVCELAGLGTDAALYDLDDGGRVLGADRSADVADNMLALMNELCVAHALELYDDGLGRTVLRPFVDPSTVASSRTFAPGVTSTLTGLERTLRATQVYNRVVVVSIQPDGYPIEAEARDLNPLSPTYNPPNGTGPIGDRPRRIVLREALSQGTLNAVALRLLIEGALFDEAIAASAIPLPGVEARQVVRFEGAGVADAFLLDAVTMPLRAGEMTMTTRRVRSLIA